jgi:cytoskeletal protein CcmA (bactofilin family)
MSIFSGRKDESDGAPADPEVLAALPTAPLAVHPEAAAGRARGFFGRGGEEEMANIGKSITIKGDLSGSEDIVVEGTVEGKIEFPNNQLTIGANGTAKAEVTAKHIVVIGRVAGNVHGTERVEIQATGVVEGDVSSPRLVVAEGAVLNGSIHMSQPKAAADTKPFETSRLLGGESREPRESRKSASSAP